MYIPDGIKGFLLDLDGLIYIGDQAVPGAMEFLTLLQKNNIAYLLVTNNASRTPDQIAEKLTKLGINVPGERILTSAIATAEYLAQYVNPQETHIYAIGELGLVTALRSMGFKLTDVSPDFVVVGLDRSINMVKLKTAVDAIRRGAQFLATNDDPIILSELGPMPGNGSIVAAIKFETGVVPTVIGKPHRPLFEMAGRILDIKLRQLAMIGDNLESDILGARSSGAYSILVLTGVTKETDLNVSAIRPDYVVHTLYDLIRAWEWS